MHPKIRLLLLAATGAVVATACADAPSSPAGAPGLSKSNTTLATTLTRDSALAGDVTASAVIGKLGGSIEVPGTGLKFTVPALALAKDTRITITAVAGDQVAYEFAPHGLVFNVPTEFKQDLKGTNWYKLESTASAEGAYFEERSRLDDDKNTVRASEFVPLSVDLASSKVTFSVKHFSGYVVATARGALE